MPVYEYRCRECECLFELRRPMGESSAPATCPDGHPNALRVLSAFASVGSTGAPAPAAPAPPARRGCGGGCACH